jgi:hypothetical protein
VLLRLVMEIVSAHVSNGRTAHIAN